MKKGLGKRLVSLILCAAMLVTMVPDLIYAAQGDGQNVTVQKESGENADAGEAAATETAAAQQSEDMTEKSLEYALNGGSFVEGYMAPDTYPQMDLPDWQDVTNPGYAFGGWYDNKELAGDAIASVSDADYKGPVVLYAKWTDSCYYVDIPANVSADGGELTFGGTADGLYADDRVQVSVQSENDWNLKDGTERLPYELHDKATDVVLENQVPVLSLSDTDKKEERTYVCNLMKEPEVTGYYKDTLTFKVAFESRDYTITYEANGGFRDDPDNPGEALLFEKETCAPGTQLDNLPIAIKNGYTFLGWCYDEACTQYVADTDRLLGDVTLYASFTENQQLESHTIATFARAIDVDGASFVLQVTDKSGAMTAEQMKAACTLTNLSDFDDTVDLTFSSVGNSTYTVSKMDGWKEGSSYKLVLDNDDLYFTGFDTSIREYEIIIHKDEVHNVRLNQNIKYIKVTELSELTVNGQRTSTVSIAAMTVGMDGAVQSEGSSTTGSFRYSGSTLKVGDQIAVYEGDVLPNIDTITSSADGMNVSFLEITGTNGSVYTYRGSKTEDVLFMPDVLPLDLAKDQDGDAGNNSVTVDLADLAFGGDELSRQLGLDEDTTVDEGDYLALYTDMSSGTPSYGKIIEVVSDDGKYIITYEPQSWEEVQAAMDVYGTEPVDGEALLENANVSALEQNIEEQAVTSGFADLVAGQVSEMAMRTESFEDLQKLLEDELGADVEIATQSADTRSAVAARAAGANKRVEVGTPQVKADLDTKLRHFDGNENGVHLGLEVTVPITFHVARYADFTITVKATFEQEVRVAINVDGEAVWKVWGIFPYIADYRVTASLDLYEYTGIGLEVNFKTEEANNLFLAPGAGSAAAQFKKKQKLANDIQGIVDELQDMMENGKEYISDKSPLMANLGQQETRSGGGEISVAKSLAERYADLLEDESDWVEIYKQNIITRHIRVILIIDIAIELDFVVSANVNISLGMTFWYKNAKRYVFCLHVKGRKATSDTINITEEQYEFTAYAMGTLGIKAGVRLTVRVGLLSTELASVGVSADVGGYVQLWGYLYYILKYAASTGRDSRAMGALYLEVGIYLEIKFRAQALSNAFTYSPTLYEAMWPLYTVGTLENVLDFTDPEETEYNLKGVMKKVRLKEDFFSMNYLDMKEGLNDGEYFTKIYEDDSDEYFVIAMTNDAFTFDPETDIITVNPGNEKSVDGEMIVTWISQPGTFNTKPFQKKVKLHWDNLRDGYYIAFQSNGGNYVNPLNQKYGTVVKRPADPVKQGYDFAGWYRDEELTASYTFPETMPDENVIVYAKWTPAQVTYTVKNYLQGSNGIYEVLEDGTVKGKAATGTEISPAPAVREGFETPAQRTATVEADGSTLIEYYYTRNRYEATYKSDDEIVATGSYRYGTMMPVPAVYKPGYEFVGWVLEGGTETEEIPMLVPAENRTYFAKWEPLTDIGYAVRYYVQNQSGTGYSLNEVRYLTGVTGSTVTAPAGEEVYDPSIYHLKDNTALPSGTVEADGSLELKVYYDLNTYKVTYDKMADDAVMPDGAESTFSVRPGEKLVTAVPTRDGYSFAGWYRDAACTEKFDNTMPAADITLYAKWDRIKVNYTVRHYQENLTPLNEYGYPAGEEKTYTLVEEESFTAPVDSEVTPAVKNYEGFEAPAAVKATVTAAEDGTGNLVVEYKYDRKEYTVAWFLYESGEANPMTVQYDAPITKPGEKEAGKLGYRVEDWYEDKDLTQKFTYDTMPAHDLAAYPKWVPEQIEYYVNYELMSGTSVVDSFTETFTGEADSTVAAPEPKVIEGYTFEEEGRLDSFKIDPYNPYILYTYQINTHTLTYQYESNDGLQSQSDNVKYGEDITRSDPQRDGYAFAGWYTDENFTEPFTDVTMPDRDVTLYGKWVDGMQSYQVAHYLTRPDGSVRLYLVENLYGAPGEVVTPPSKAPEGYEEVTPQSHTLVQGSVANNRITYTYSRKSYQINYVLNGATSDTPTTQTLLYGDTIQNYPNRDGYQFVGWYTDEALQNPLSTDTVPASDLTLYAKWEVLKSSYRVEHYKENSNQNGYYLDRTDYLSADTDTIVEPAVRQYEGYTSPAPVEGTVSGKWEEQLVIRYEYTCNRHTLTLHDASAEDYINVRNVTETVKYGSMIREQRRWGYTFGGWFKDASYTEPFTGTMPDEDLTLYAKWTPEDRTYFIIYEKQNLQGIYETADIVEGTAEIGSYITPADMGYEGFTAPEIQTEQIVANRANRFVIQYKRNRHTVTFKLKNGQSDVVRKGYYGSEVTAPVPSRTGYTFLGWGEKVADTMPDEDLTYTAQWQVNSYKVSFMVDGEDLGDTYQYGETIKIPKDPTKDGYTFLGWSGEIPQTTPWYNVSVSAMWKLDRYPISYDLDGGSEYENPTTYTYESGEIVLKAPTKREHEFLGWSGTEIDGIQKTVTIPKNSMDKRSYKAHWREKTYTITFLPNDFQMDIAPMTIAWSEAKKLPAYGKSPKGYTFVGWAKTRQQPSQNPYMDYGDQATLRYVQENMTLYPVYRPDRYKVTFDYNLGKLYKEYNWHDYGSDVSIPQIGTDDEHHRWGYVLEGWDLVEGADGYLDASEPTFKMEYASDVELRARWAPNNKYLYTPSDFGRNKYTITDDKNREISFTFCVDGKQTDLEETGDYGLGNGADYVINMDNMSYDVVHKNYTKMRIHGRYNVHMIIDGYAIMRVSYKTADGKEVKWQTKTNDLLESAVTKFFDYTLDCGDAVDVKSIKLEFDADGGKADEYMMDQLRLWVEFSK